MVKDKFLVIGCNSFSGSNFVKELLLSDYKVLGVSRSDDTKKIFLPFLWESNIKKGVRNQDYAAVVIDVPNRDNARKGKNVAWYVVCFVVVRKACRRDNLTGPRLHVFKELFSYFRV